jgi:uncharacterized protein (DUF2235 family)
MPKRLVMCCDGTWNTADQACPTNVTKLALGLAASSADGMEQRVFYHRGVGTGAGDRIRGGAFGVGLSQNVQDTYRFVVENYEPGDELFFFGFSRGAFTARSTAGFLRNSGILKPQFENRIPQAYALYRDRTAHPRGVEAQLFRRTYSYESRIRCIGVWDTVGALGVPLTGVPLVDLFNKRWQFHDTTLSTTVDAAFHALAIDEKRRPFEPTLWQQQPDAVGQRLEQVWFAGVHSDVGGGYPEGELADITLLWMVSRAESCGLAFRPDAFPAEQPAGAREQVIAVRPDAMGKLHESRTGAYTLLPPLDRAIGVKDPEHEHVASTAKLRWDDDAGYRPPGLATYLDGKPDVTPIPVPRPAAETAGQDVGSPGPEASPAASPGA